MVLRERKMVLREREIVLNQNQLKLDQQKFDAGEEERRQFYFCTSANRTNLSALCVYVCVRARACACASWSGCLGYLLDVIKTAS